MLNKAERQQMENLQKDVAYLRKRLDSAEEKLGQAQERIEDFHLLVDDLELAIGRQLGHFKKKLVELVTGTPVEDQS